MNGKALESRVTNKCGQFKNEHATRPLFFFYRRSPICGKDFFFLVAVIPKWRYKKKKNGRLFCSRLLLYFLPALQCFQQRVLEWRFAIAIACISIATHSE